MEVTNFAASVQDELAAQAAMSPQRVATPVDEEVEPPVFYDEAGLCSICAQNFLPGERCLRLRCRRMFHAYC